MTTLRLIDCSDDVELDDVIREELATQELPRHWAPFIRKLPGADPVVDFAVWLVWEQCQFAHTPISVRSLDQCVLLSFPPEEEGDIAQDDIRLHALRTGMIEIANALDLVYRRGRAWYSTPTAEALWGEHLLTIQGKIGTWLYELYDAEGLLGEVEEMTGEILH